MTTTLLTEGFFSFVKGASSLTNLVPANRMFPLKAPPQTKTPYMTFRTISNPREVTHDGNGGFGRARIQATFHSPDYTEAKKAAKAFVNLMNGYSGPMGDVDRVACQVDNEIDDPLEDDSKIYAVPVDVLMWASEVTS